MYTTPVPDGKFCQQTRERIGESLYLLGYLIREAKWETGTLLTTQQRIASDTGFPETTVKRWLQVLSEAGEIATKRVLGGTLIRILDYTPCAQTRGFKCRKTQTTSGLSNRSPAVHGKTTDDLSNRPPAIPEKTASDPCNIEQNKNQNMVQNGFQTPASLLSSLADGTKRLGKQPGDIFDYTDPWDRKVEKARELIKKLPEEEQVALAKQALEAMAHDSKPFVRIFVKQDGEGNLIASSAQGRLHMLVRMAEILAARRGSGDLCAATKGYGHEIAEGRKHEGTERL